MDKLRALEYLQAAAEEGSLSGAARRLHVSVAAVSKQVSALERHLGVILFERSRRGLVLTSDAGRFVMSCVGALEQLAAAEEALGGASRGPHGTLTLGAPEFVLNNCLVPALPRFRARYPDLQLDLRIVSQPSDPAAEAVDVCLLFGWHDARDFVQKRVAQTRFHVLAAPEYWAARGVPSHPRDLDRHECLCFRNPAGTLLDLWEFERGPETASVAVKGWLSSSHRDALVEAAIAGAGVVRVTGVTTWHQVRAGRLVAVLEDWEQKAAPPVHAYYRPSQRRAARVRAIVSFAAELFAELEADREARPSLPGEEPAWHSRRYPRASRSTGEPG